MPPPIPRPVPRPPGMRRARDGIAAADHPANRSLSLAPVAALLLRIPHSKNAAIADMCPRVDIKQFPVKLSKLTNVIPVTSAGRPLPLAAGPQI